MEQFWPVVFIFEQGFSGSPLPQPKVATLLVGISGSVTVGCGRVGLGEAINVSSVLSPTTQAVPCSSAYI